MNQACSRELFGVQLWHSTNESSTDIGLQCKNWGIVLNWKSKMFYDGSMANMTSPTFWLGTTSNVHGILIECTQQDAMNKHHRKRKKPANTAGEFGNRAQEYQSNMQCTTSLHPKISMLTLQRRTRSFSKKKVKQNAALIFCLCRAERKKRAKPRFGLEHTLVILHKIYLTLSHQKVLLHTLKFVS